MKKNNKKGFTLAELLIVVAIIAVLVAVAIPVFTTQLEKSRDAVTCSNLRAAYAEAMSDIIADPAISSSTKPVVCKGKAGDTNLSGTAAELPFTGDAIADIAAMTGPDTVDVTFTYNETTNTVTATIS